MKIPQRKQNTMLEYLDTIQERRDITQMPFPDLQKILMKFILAVKWRKGSLR